MTRRRALAELLSLRPSRLRRSKKYLSQVGQLVLSSMYNEAYLYPRGPPPSELRSQPISGHLPPISKLLSHLSHLHFSAILMHRDYAITTYSQNTCSSDTHPDAAQHSRRHCYYFKLRWSGWAHSAPHERLQTFHKATSFIHTQDSVFRTSF